MKVATLTLFFLTLLVLGYSQCPTGCANCTTTTRCTACQTGFFMLNQAFCAKCPDACATCVQGTTGFPLCRTCISPAQLDSTGKCFFCDPSCKTCSGQPRNCTSCNQGLQVLTSNNISSCQPLRNCTILNCASCSTDNTTNTTLCSRCLPGYFPFKTFCFPCRFPCSICYIDNPVLWTSVIAPLWDRLIRSAFNISTGVTPPAGTFPQFANNLNFSNMTQYLKRGWTEAFTVFKAVQPLIPTSTLNLQVITQFRFYQDLDRQNITWDQKMKLILQRFSNFTNKNWTLLQYNNRTGQILANLTKCAQCLPSFQNNTNGSCDRCTAYCKQCLNGRCITCENNFFVNSTGYCLSCSSNCLTCFAAANNCTSCNPPASLSSSKTCILCKEPCLTCQTNNISICTTCKRPFSSTPNGGVCFRCDQDLCLNCLSTNNSICLQCQSGATLINGRCQICPPNCANCITGNFTLCVQCSPGFTLFTVQNNSKCVPCGPGCIKCESTQPEICLICQKGGFLKQTNGKCQKCKQGCKQCSSLENCTLLDQGVVIVSGQLVSCRVGCKSCDTDNIEKCRQCFSKYYLSSSKCYQCGNGCQQCSSPTNCSKCADGLLLLNGNCTECRGNCLTCSPSNNTICLTCKRGFSLIGSQCLYQCQNGCLQCDSTNKTICQKCIIGHALVKNGKCMKCLGSCSGTCDPKNITACLSCADGFELRSNQCVRCSPGCANCINGGCSLCVPGFTLTETGNGSIICRQKCRQPCNNCSQNTCFSCIAGFTLKNNVCTIDLSCNPYCQFCSLGTEKIANGSCIPCPSKCSTCTNGTCIQCQGGFFLDSGLCKSCPLQCRTCFNNFTCDDCASGFVKEILSMADSISQSVLGDKCIPCSTNCKTCQIQPERCISCPDGYRLKGSRCSGMFNVGYEYEINQNHSDFINNSTSQTFLNVMSNQTKVNSTEIQIQYVREGSTIIGGSISSSSLAQASSIQSGLGSSLSGFDVISSSSTVNYGDTQYIAPPEQQSTISTEQSKLGLIIGAGIGGSIVLIILLGLACEYKYKSSMRQKISNDSSQIVLRQRAKKGSNHFVISDI